MLSLVLMQLLIPFLGSHAAATTASSSSSLLHTGIVVNESTGAITFPLIPHHIQRARRGLTEHDNSRNSNDINNSNSNGSRRRPRVLEQGKAAATTAATTELSTDPEAMGALYMGYGTHYVDLWVGTPTPQRQTVIVDTGSAQTAFPCGGCDNCGFPAYHTDAYFEESRSVTFDKSTCEKCSRRATCNAKTDRCEIDQYYSEGSSWEAYEVNDTCYAGGFHNTALLEGAATPTTHGIDPSQAAAFGFPLRFGCQTKVTGLFQTQLADGILGMCDAKSAFWHQMYRAHKIKTKQFSLCFSRPRHSSKQGSEAGAMTLGGTDERLHANPMVYTTTKGTSSELPGGKKSGYFDVHIRKLYLRAGSGGQSAATTDSSAIVLELRNANRINENGGVIVDSGTTDSYFGKIIQRSLKKNFKTLTGGIAFHHDRVQLTEKDLAAYPTILIQLVGDEALNKAIADQHGGASNVVGLAGDLDSDHPLDVIVAVPASHYMERISEGNYENRIYATETDGTVLGANTMMGHDVMFDPTNKRVGWAESSCGYSELVAKNGFPDVLGDEPSTVETKETMEEEDAEEEEQEELKESFDEKHVETEIQNEQTGENVNVEEKPQDVPETNSREDEKEAVDGEKIESEPTQVEETESVAIRANDAETETKQKMPWSPGGSAHNFDFPIDDIKKQITANPAMAGGGIAVLVLLSCCFCVCAYRCCCRRGTKNTYALVPELEMNGRKKFKDDFEDNYEDDDDEDDHDYDVEEDDIDII